VSVTVDDRPPAPAAPPAAVRPDPPLTVIESRSGVAFADFQELWRFRELLYYLALREIKLRYKQTVLGVGWSLFQPLSIMAMFVLFLGRSGGLADGVNTAVYPHYALFVMAGALPWTFFATTALNGGHSLLINERLVTKIYFPRLLLPLSCSGAALLDLCVASVLMAGGMAYYGVAPGWSAVFLPLIVLLMVLAGSGIAIFFAALIVAQRDFRYLLLFGVQLWMLATPCIYDPAAGNRWLALNPAFGLIRNFRAALFGEPMDLPALALSGSVGLLILAAGLLYFRKVERTFADTI
jgi:lipopolysaccharide transport system permease protein